MKWRLYGQSRVLHKVFEFCAVTQFAWAQVRGGLDDDEKNTLVQIQQVIIEDLVWKPWVIQKEARLGSDLWDDHLVGKWDLQTSNYYEKERRARRL